VGDVVEEGAPLAGLDQEDLLTRLDTAHAELSRQRAQLDLVRRGYTPRELQAYKASVENAELSLREATEDLEHVRELHASGFASDEELDSAEYAVEQAKQARDQAVDALDVLLEGSTREEIQAAEAGYRAAEVAVRDAENSLGDAVIYSPMSGVVLERLVTEGSVVVSTLASFAQGDVMFSIGDLSRMKAYAGVDENDIGSVRIGQNCVVDVDAYPDETFDGTVLKIHPQADTQSGVTSFTAEIEVPNPDGRLMAGMSCEVEIVTETLENILLVPDRAIAERDDRAFVFVVDEEKHIEAREIETGKTNYEETEVLSGLEEGEQVIVRGVPSDLLDEIMKEEDEKGKEEGGSSVEVRVE
jgi:HlyD family secretion protein